LLNDDWLLEEKCNAAFAQWKIEGMDLNRKMETLSGGQKTKVFLSGIGIHQPEIILLDEPSNHLDGEGRTLLYEYIQTTPNTLVVVSHDRILLNLLDAVCEISKRGITRYGGNYDFYIDQKRIEAQALSQEVKDKEKALRKAKEVERESLERKQKLDARGKKKQEKAGLPTISMNTFKNNAEKSTARIKDVHAEKIETISEALSKLRAALSDISKIKLNVDDTTLHRGKNLITATNVNFGYPYHWLSKQPLNFQIRSGERIVIKGSNGSGKTTLIKMILGQIQPLSGIINRAEVKSVYIDQDYSLINDALSIYEQVELLNYAALPDHELKIRLSRFLFKKEHWDKLCKSLSGGEKMRLMLCCLTINHHAPDMIILDEPTNNLDIQNIEILTAAMNQYQGTLIIVSHDQYFLEQMSIEKEIILT
jgi:ATPase subunit of ABC transporter with duplicated ATPase domains